MTISVMVEEMGISDPAYFTEFFKRQTGSATKDIKKQAGPVFDQSVTLPERRFSLAQSPFCTTGFGWPA